MKQIGMFILVFVFFIISGCAPVQINPAQIQEIRTAAVKVLPAETKVEVSTKTRFLSKPDIIISAHLLEGHSADDNSPYVRGDYGTHEKLTGLVRYRCAKVLKSIFTDTALPDGNKIIIIAKHGVRQITVGIAFGGTDVAMTIYEISISLGEARKLNWSMLDEDKIMELWSVDRNIIPSLQITSGY